MISLKPQFPEKIEKAVGITTLVLNGILTTVQIISLLRSPKHTAES